MLGPRRQVLLFLGAILAPSALLLVVGLRLLVQERELSEKRRSDERLRFAAEVRDALSARLEAIRRGGGAEVALSARLDNGSLVLPWEGGGDFNRDLPAEFAARIRAGAQEEFGGATLERALGSYGEAVRLARTPAQAAYARLLYARTLDKLKRSAEALPEFERLLSAAPDFTDEEGVPLRLYAADRLAKLNPAALAVARESAGRAGALPPAACYLLSGVLGKLGPAADPLRRAVAERTREMDQAVTLQKDFSGLHLPPSGRVWMLYGEDPWLVSRGPDAAIAVRARPALAPLEERWKDRRLRFETGEPLGEDFPGLRAAFSVADDAAWTSRGRTQRYVFFSALALVLGATAFGASLLWHDLRREVRLAEMRSQFVSSVSHELKTPLTAIRMFAETLEMGRSSDPAAQQEYLQTIVNECERLSRLVDDVLQFSRLEQGRKIYHFRPTALAEVVEAAARAMEYPLAQQGFKLKVDLEAGDDLPPVAADRDALEQALLNLLSNAMKYSGESRTIELVLRCADGHAVLRVTDYGVGIAGAEQARIFEKYYRVPSRENQLIPGTGLGLTLVAHIARAHGGRVEVRSAPGEGSTFSIYLPIAMREET